MKYVINNFTMKYLMEFGSTNDRIKHTIGNDGLRYAIRNDVIKYAVTNNSI